MSWDNIPSLPFSGRVGRIGITSSLKCLVEFTVVPSGVWRSLCGAVICLSVDRYWYFVSSPFSWWRLLEAYQLYWSWRISFWFLSFFCFLFLWFLPWSLFFSLAYFGFNFFLVSYDGNTKIIHLKSFYFSSTGI